jgi:hypothetical protein
MLAKLKVSSQLLANYFHVLTLWYTIVNNFSNLCAVFYVFHSWHLFQSCYIYYSFSQDFWAFIIFLMTLWNNIHSLYWISYFTTYALGIYKSNPISFQFSFCDYNEKIYSILFIWLVRRGKLDLWKTLSASKD